MPLDVGRVTHLLEQMHRSEDNAGDPIAIDKVLVTDGARGFTWEDYGTGGVTAHGDLTELDVIGQHDWVLENYRGEGHVMAVIADAGAAETLDLSAANVYAIGLSTGCTLTFSGVVSDGRARVWTLVFSGEFTVTWPGSVVWMDGAGVAPDAAETLAVTIATIDGGTTFLASAGRGSGASLSDDDPLANGTADPGVSTDASRSDHVHPKGNVVGAILIQDTPAGSPLVFSDLLQNSAGDDLLYADV